MNVLTDEQRSRGVLCAHIRKLLYIYAHSGGVLPRSHLVPTNQVAAAVTPRITRAGMRLRVRGITGHSLANLGINNTHMITTDAAPAAKFWGLPHWGWVLLAGIILFFPYLGIENIDSSHEARIASVVRGMLRDGDWLLPRIGDEVRLKKPPLAYWLSAFSAKAAGGLSESSARIPSALASLGAMLLVWWLGRRLWNDRAGLLAALAFGTTAEVWEMGRTMGIEMPMLFFNLAALCCWWCSTETDNITSRGRWLVGCYACLGLSFLEKGPVGPLVVGLLIAVWLTVDRAWNKRLVLSKAHAAGGGVFLLLILPWFLLVLWQLPGAWSTWFNESAGRYEGFDHLEPFYYFFVKVLGDGLPWWPFALFGIWLLRSEEDDDWRRSMRFVWTWIAFILIFFSLPHCKKAYYILFVYPALALATGAVFDRLLTQTTAGNIGKILRAVLGLAAVVLLVGGAIAPRLVPSMLASGKIRAVYVALQPFVPYFSIGLVALGVVLMWAALRGSYRTIYSVVFAGTCGCMAMRLVLAPSLNEIKGDKQVIEYIRQRTVPSDELVAYNVSGYPTYLYYLDDHLAAVKNPARLYKIYGGAQGTQAVYVLMREKDIRRLSRTWVVVPKQLAQEEQASTWEPFVQRLGQLPELDHVDADTCTEKSSSGFSAETLNPGFQTINTPSVITVRLREGSPQDALLQLAGENLQMLPMDAMITPLTHPETSSQVRWVVFAMPSTAGDDSIE